MQRNQKTTAISRISLKFLTLTFGLTLFALTFLAMSAPNAQAAPASAVNIVGGFNVLLLTDTAITKVHRCHRRGRFGWVRRWRTRAMHRHRGSRCRPREVRRRYRDDYDAPRYYAPRHYRRNCVWVGPVRVCD